MIVAIQRDSEATKQEISGIKAQIIQNETDYADCVVSKCKDITP